MDMPAGSTPARLSPTGSEFAEQFETSLEQAGGATSESMSCAAYFLPPCTATECTSCQITAHITKLNETLWSARLELRKLPATPVQLSLVSIGTLCLPRPERSQIRPAAVLVSRLLKTHPCVTALDISTSSFKGSEALIRDALQDNAFIKSIKLNFSDFVMHKVFSSAITSLINVEELDCNSDSICPVSFFAVLTEVLTELTSLRALRLPNLVPGGNRGADQFLAALSANSSIEELSLHDSVIAQASPESRTMFSAYIASNATLRKLSIGAHTEVHCISFKTGAHTEVHCPSLKCILQGLLENRTVTDASLTGYIIDLECAAMVAKMLAGNNVLKRLNIPFCTLNAFTIGRGVVDTTVDCTLWHQALVVNRTLEAVTLYIGIFKPESWKSLFRMLSTKDTRLMLTITGYNCDYYLWDNVYDVLIGSGAEENVFFDTNIQILENADMLRCSAFSEFNIMPYGPTRDEANQIFLLLSCLTNVRSANFVIWIPGSEKADIAAIAHYVTTTSVLRKLGLSIWVSSRTFEGDMKEYLTDIYDALRHNVTIKELRVDAKCIDEETVELLTDAVKSSRTIRRFYLNIDSTCVASRFLRCLRVSIENNYKLLNVNVESCVGIGAELAGDLFAIHDTARRNTDIVAWASQFLTGTVYDRFSAAALERVARHPTLLAELAEQLSVSDAEASTMVRQKLRCFESMDNFMQLAGVVRSRVRCHDVEDGRKQLDSLTEYCWRAVRNHLCLEDIKE